MVRLPQTSVCLGLANAPPQNLAAFATFTTCPHADVASVGGDVTIDAADVAK